MGLCFCHVTGGVNNFDFYKYLTESIIEAYRNQGCKVERVYYLKNSNC